VNTRSWAPLLTLLTNSILFVTLTATAQRTTPTTTAYEQTNLVSNVPRFAENFDRRLVNPWGLALSSNKPFHVANNANGSFSSYDSTGAEESLGGVIALAPGELPPSHPTGVAFNPTDLFAPHGSLASPFLFASADGTISGEYADSRGDILQSTILVVDNSSRGAVYTGLAVLTPNCCAPFLAVANFHDRFIETYTSFFAPLGIPGAFIDPNLPSGYAPFNIQVVGNQVFVTYAMGNSTGTAPLTCSGNGIVDIYNLDGSFVRRFATRGPLNAPWGVAKASAEFGVFSNDILIGNFGDGTINAFNPNTGQFVGQLRDGTGHLIVNAGLRGLAFGQGPTGDPNTLYFTAGLKGGKQGLFGAISVATGKAISFGQSQTLPGNSLVVPCGN